MSREELANLPGRPEEQGWLRERMEVLTVREGIALDAALQRGAPADARDAVNLLANLDEYEVVGGIQSYEDLGLYDLEENDAKLLALRDYIDLDKLGRRYEEQHPGLFVGGCYVIFPERELLQQYDGVTLPGPEYSWSLRLKLGSPAVPEGVWLALPDYNDIMDVRPGEIRLALDALQVRTIQDCTLLEARCSLPGITGLETAYDGRLEDLIYDGQNLGFILQDQNQGQKGFLQTYLWALEPEDWPIAEDLYAVLEDAYEHYDREDSPLYPRELLRELLLGLHSMCRGAESVYFNGRTNITSTRFLVFGVKDLIHANSSVKDALLFNLLSYLSDRLLTQGNTVATLDELYLWLSNLTTIEYIRNCLKRVRKRNSALILASQNLEDFDIQGVRELTRPLFAIPTHQFLFHGGKVDKKFYMDNLHLESAEYDLISSPNNGVCLFKCGADRNLLDVHAPPHKHALIVGGEG